MCFAAAASPLRIPWRHAASLHLASSLQKTIEAINKEFNNNEAAGLGNTLLTFADEFSNMLATTAGGSKVGAGRVHCGVWRHFSSNAQAYAAASFPDGCTVLRRRRSAHANLVNTERLDASQPAHHMRQLPLRSHTCTTTHPSMCTMLLQDGRINGRSQCLSMFDCTDITNTTITHGRSLIKHPNFTIIGGLQTEVYVPRECQHFARPSPACWPGS